MVKSVCSEAGIEYFCFACAIHAGTVRARMRVRVHVLMRIHALRCLCVKLRTVDE